MKALRVISVVLAVAILVTFAGCSQKSVSNEEAEPMANENAYALAARELILNVCEDYYSLDTHILKGEPREDSGSACVWPFASFLEALSDVYALFPSDETVKKYYVDALDYGLDGFKVGANITYPTGSSREVYYNAVYHSTGDYYYDDDAWVCFQLLHAYELLGDEKYLKESEQTLKFFKTGIDDALAAACIGTKPIKAKTPAPTDLSRFAFCGRIRSRKTRTTSIPQRI